MTQDSRSSVQHKRAKRLCAHADIRITPMIIKIIILGFLDAFSLYSAFLLLSSQRWLLFTALITITVVVNWVYWSKNKLPAKYLIPGLVFLFIFQMFAIVYSSYVAFTNYGTGHNVDKSHAISSIVQASLEKVPESATVPITVVKCGGDYGFLYSDSEGNYLLGTAETPSQKVDVETDANGLPAVPGCESLDFAGLLEHQNDITELSVPVSTDLRDGMLRTSDGTSAFVFRSTLEYDAKNDTFTDTQTGEVYRDTGSGSFVSASGKQLSPGWKINVGFANFVKAFSAKEIRGSFVNVFLWTIEYSLISVASTFALGLFLAVAFNNSRMKGRRFYRSILILPYAFPGFLSALVWAGLLNEKFGFINQVLLGGADIPWLQSPVLAKVSVLVVNLWLGFPYMFLVCMGALQSIPEDISEAAKLDGASAWQIFRLIKFPLLLVSVAPLLISSFAMTFNNFNLIYMLTSGGPVNSESQLNVGSTDILISMVYKLAFVGANRDYGLASAFAIIIFFIVALISAIGFRMSKSLEEVN
ncbi:ABC transporter permease subunit [Arcanobacterium phocae]|uniref:ABC transporter permease subunit n=1 Tax=Arcanobacterium phocae TaxID=131112 RepID=UPI001C0F0F1D|nr:ABC transporter permease subunit [Arcanobacterium phocae]